MEQIMVSICCLAYNHDKYIRQCLDGFIMQQCNFKFEVLIHDDASTDHTADIIREYEKKYPEIIKPIYQVENQHSKKIPISRTYQYPRAKGKYIAFCEGDDYWVDPLKLQKQFDALENNNSCVACVHRVRDVNENGEKLSTTKPPFDLILSSGILYSDEVRDLFNIRYSFQTSSYFMKASLIKKIVTDTPTFIKVSDVGDVPLCLYMAANGNFFFIDEEMSCYRHGAYYSWSEFQKRDVAKRIKHHYSLVNMFKEYGVYINESECFKEKIEKHKEMTLICCVENSKDVPLSYIKYLYGVKRKLYFILVKYFKWKRNK